MMQELPALSVCKSNKASRRACGSSVCVCVCAPIISPCKANVITLPRLRVRAGAALSPLGEDKAAAQTATAQTLPHKSMKAVPRPASPPPHLSK